MFHAPIQARLAEVPQARQRQLALFDLMGEFFAEPGFRGCAFVRAIAEAAPGSPVTGVCDDSRAWLCELFTDLARAAGAQDPDRLAQQCAILHDGATVAAQMDRQPAAAEVARGMAAMLLDAAVARGG